MSLKPAFQGFCVEFLMKELDRYRKSKQVEDRESFILQVTCCFLKLAPASLDEKEEPLAESLAQVDNDAPNREEGIPEPAKKTIHRWLNYHGNTARSMAKFIQSPKGKLTQGVAMKARLLKGVGIKALHTPAAHVIWSREKKNHESNNNAAEFQAENKKRAAAKEGKKAHEEHKKILTKPLSKLVDRQNVIDNLPNFMQEIANVIHLYSGWVVTIFAAGLNPSTGGHPRVIRFYSRRIERKAWKDKIEPVIGSFVKKVFSIEECQSWALKAEEQDTAVMDNDRYGVKDKYGDNRSKGGKDDQNVGMFDGSVWASEGDSGIAKGKGKGKEKVENNSQRTQSDCGSLSPPPQPRSALCPTSPLFSFPPVLMSLPAASVPQDDCLQRGLNSSSPIWEESLIYMSLPQGSVPHEPSVCDLLLHGRNSMPLQAASVHQRDKEVVKEQNMSKRNVGGKHKHEDGVEAEGGAKRSQAAKSASQVPKPNKSTKPTGSLRITKSTWSKSSPAVASLLEDQIGPSSALVLATMPTLPTNAPEYMVKVWELCTAVGWDPKWCVAIAAWLEQEKQGTFKRADAISNRNCPVAVGDWISHAHSLKWRPHQLDLPNFTNKFSLWWGSMQPEDQELEDVAGLAWWRKAVYPMPEKTARERQKARGAQDVFTETLNELLFVLG
ncbi:hypothetical protein BDP27DRAFT_1370143 [Rhodocollybia butyracea]|uniref:Uncharacterized protein n=1 Tax=Rhodocollybia butyracea TaxID=206335 RepID=A0A9P5PEZ7_9AGAR|nr:hypothetical protein BDP27DRAFT_1370143 [Rhodocollybia butyracea]